MKSYLTNMLVACVASLPLSAMAAIKGGLSREKALRAITCDAAAILGIDEQTGSITPGKDADLQLYPKDCDPLDLMSEPSMVMVSGNICKGERI